MKKVDLMLKTILPPNEVMAKYIKNLSNFHQKSWKVIKREHHKQDRHNLENMKNPEDVLILLFLLAINMNS